MKDEWNLCQILMVNLHSKSILLNYFINKLKIDLKSKKLTIILSFILSFIISFFILNKKGDSWEEEFRSAFYKITQDSVPNYVVEKIDESGIPFVYYAEQNNIKASTQYNPTIVANYAYDYYLRYVKTKDELNKNYFLNCVHWLQDHITIKNNYAIYEFNWQQPWYDSVKTPFTSGMTSGLAIRAFTYAFLVTHSSHYLYFSNLLLRGFYTPIQDGGFTYKEDNGWWFEEIADKNMNTPRILDGHIFAIQGLQTYYHETKNDSALFVINQGLKSLKHYLPFYNAGNGKIYYDKYKKLADKKYQQVLTQQMNLLAYKMNDEFFKNYFNEWNSYLNRPYIVKILSDFNKSGILLFLVVELILFIIITSLFSFFQILITKKRPSKY